MTDARRSRRGFLRTLAGGVLAAPLLPRFLAAEERFSDALAGLGPGLPPPELLRERYMLDPAVVYLNHASIGTVPRSVHEAHTEYLALCEADPWLHMWGGAWDEAALGARASLGRLLGAPTEEVAVTHNTTEGFNLLAHGLPLGPGDEVLFSTLNHDGASVCWEMRAPERGFRVRRFDLPYEDAASLTGDDLVAMHLAEIRDETRVLAFPHIDNTVGFRHPLRRLTREARARGVEVVAADGAQTVGMIPLALADSGVDVYAGSPHKWVQSPKGLGLLRVREALVERIRPMWVTWGQRRFAGTVRVLTDYGTRNLPAVLALGDAADVQWAMGPDQKEARLREVRTRMLDRVESSPRLRWRSPRRWEDGGSLVAVEVVGRRADALAEALFRDHGVVVRAFATDRLNHLRVSPNVVTTDGEVDAFFDLLEAA